MAPKTASKSKASAKVESKKSYKEMITIAITTLKDRLGSSRQAIKKFIASKYNVGTNFDTQFNLALSKGVKSGDFSQPKGASGPVKLVKKETKKPAAPKKAAPKKTATKTKPAAKKVTKKPVAKKVSKPAVKKVTKKPAPKKVTKKPAPKKTVAPKKAAPKKAAPKKAAPKKAAPKKAKK